MIGREQPGGIFMTHSQSSRRGFTLIELAAALGVVVALAATGLIAIGQPGSSSGDGLAAARQAARLKKDELQLRGIGQAMIVWAQNNADWYPLPSRVDKKNETVKDEGRAKDTTANIYSIMIFNGSLSTEIMISPLEKNPSVQAWTSYSFNAPKKAVTPAKALWDPGFTVSLGPETKGHASYAHLEPAGKRLKRWTNNFAK